MSRKKNKKKRLSRQGNRAPTTPTNHTTLNTSEASSASTHGQDNSTESEPRYRLMSSHGWRTVVATLKQLDAWTVLTLVFAAIVAGNVIFVYCFPRSVFGWWLLIALLVYCIASYFSPSGWLRRCASSCLGAATVSSIIPSLSLKFHGSLGNFEGLVEAAPCLAPLFIVVALTCIAFDISVRYPQFPIASSNQIVVAAIVSVLALYGISFIASQGNVSSSQTTSGANSPIVGQGNVTINNNGISIEEAERLWARTQLPANGQEIQVVRELLARASSEAQSGRKLAKRAIDELQKTGNPEKVLVFLIDLAEELENSGGNVDKNDMAQIHSEIGAILFIQKDFVRANDYLSRALAVRKDDIESTILFGHVCLFQYLLEDAEAAYRRAMKLCNDKRCVNGMTSNIATVFAKSGKFEEALKLYEEAIEFSREHSGSAAVAANLQNQGNCLLGMGQAKLARVRFHEAIVQYEKELPRYRSQVALLLSSWGLLELTQGDPSAAGPLLRRALEIAQAIGDDWHIAIARLNLSQFHMYSGNVHEAEVEANLALPVFKITGTTEGVVKTYSQLGQIQRAKGQLVASESMFREGIAFAEKAKQPKYVADLQNGLASIKLLNGQLNEALKELNLALAVHLKCNALEEASIDYSSIGIAYRRLKEYDKAEENFQKALDICISRNDKVAVLQHQYNLGLLEMDRDKLDRAEEIFVKIAPRQEALGLEVYAAMSRHSLAGVYSAKGEFEKALSQLAISRAIYSKLRREDKLSEIDVHIRATKDAKERSDKK